MRWLHTAVINNEDCGNYSEDVMYTKNSLCLIGTLSYDHVSYVVTFNFMELFR